MPSRAAADPVASFRGFPPEAFAFFAGLEADNSKAYWEANKSTYEASVKGPMLALAAEVPEEYRPLKMFRPYRDVRFSKDKTPYKTACGAVGEREGGSLLYVAVSAEELMIATGYYGMAADQLERFRAAVDDEATGPAVAAMVAALEKAGYRTTAMESLKTAPRGYAKDHPRIELLRRKGLVVTRTWAPAAWMATRKVLARVDEVCADAAPLTGWLDQHVGPSETPPEERDFR